MKFYQPIEGLLEPRRRGRRGRVTFGLFGAVGIGLVLGWALSADRQAEARTDRIISLAAPDFTEILSEVDPALEDAILSARLQGDLGERLVGPPEFVHGTIRRNQTLLAAMRDVGANRDSIQAVVASLEGVFDFRRAQPGDDWEARLDETGSILSFRYTVSPEEVYEASRDGDGYHSGRVDIPTEIVVVALGGTVTSSVHRSVAELGEGTALASRFIEVFGWDFDFSRDGRPGDTFRIVVEKVMLDGQFLRYGRVLAAEYQGSSGTLRAFAWQSPEGRTGYYTPDGEPLRRTWLRAPLNYRRISSTFTRRRYHPVLRRYRPHYGVDFAADTGTPIWAIADGSVTFAGERGGNGNLVVIEHEGGVESLYAHLSGFAQGVERGHEVRQGEVIGYVGSTGLSTGPHLHLAVRVDGEFVDPLGLESNRGPRLEGEVLAAFQQAAVPLGAELDAVRIAAVDPSQFEPIEDLAEDELPSDFGIFSDDEGEYE